VGFRTDGEISRSDRLGTGPGRELRRFDFAAWGAADAALEADGAVEAPAPVSRDRGKAWDQFKVNEERFGVVSTFKSDLSQYTTVLDQKKITKEMRARAERIAKELERGGAHVRDEEYDDGAGADEEDLFSAVQRGPGGGEGGANGCVWGEAPTGGEAGKALLASLRAAPAPRSSEGDHRALVAPKLQAWWRAKRLAAGGEAGPPGEDSGLVCPFSGRVFGDVSQLVTHWAGALPRAVDAQSASETPSQTASQFFGRLAQELRWSEMSGVAGLDAALPTDAARQGSVWESILTRVGRAGADVGTVAATGGAAERSVFEFTAEAVRLKCWRRDQKIEHREVMEGIAAGLAIYALAQPLVGQEAAWERLEGAAPGVTA